jgi:hypothetical protein
MLQDRNKFLEFLGFHIVVRVVAVGLVGVVVGGRGSKSKYGSSKQVVVEVVVVVLVIVIVDK